MKTWYATKEGQVFSYMYWTRKNPRPIAGELTQHSDKLGCTRVSCANLPSQYVHRLVWEEFNGPIPLNYEINHIDGNRSNNNLSNLELVTKELNMQHAFVLELHPQPATPLECIELGRTFNSLNQAARELDLWVQNISKVLQGKRKSTGGYTFRILK